MLAGCDAELSLTVADLGQQLAWDGEPIEQPVVPLPAADVVEHGAGGVARIHGMHFASGEPEQEEAVDGAETNLACARPLKKPRDVGKQPRKLGRREIRIDDESCCLS